MQIWFPLFVRAKIENPTDGMEPVIWCSLIFVLENKKQKWRTLKFEMKNKEELWTSVICVGKQRKKTARLDHLGLENKEENRRAWEFHVGK